MDDNAIPLLDCWPWKSEQLAGGFNVFLFQPNLDDWFRWRTYLWEGFQPPTRQACAVCFLGSSCGFQKPSLDCPQNYEWNLQNNNKLSPKSPYMGCINHSQMAGLWHRFNHINHHCIPMSMWTAGHPFCQEIVTANVLELAKNKVSSNVVERCFEATTVGPDSAELVPLGFDGWWFQKGLLTVLSNLRSPNETIILHWSWFVDLIRSIFEVVT